MSGMKRTTVSVSEEFADRIFTLRKDDRFIRYSYSELIRMLLSCGLESLEQSGQKASGGAG